MLILTSCSDVKRLDMHAFVTYASKQGTTSKRCSSPRQQQTLGMPQDWSISLQLALHLKKFTAAPLMEYQTFLSEIANDARTSRRDLSIKDRNWMSSAEIPPSGSVTGPPSRPPLQVVLEGGGALLRSTYTPRLVTFVSPLGDVVAVPFSCICTPVPAGHKSMPFWIEMLKYMSREELCRHLPDSLGYAAANRIDRSVPEAMMQTQQHSAIKFPYPWPILIISKCTSLLLFSEVDTFLYASAKKC